MKKKSVVVVLGVMGCAGAALGRPDLATFDSLTEGYFSTVIVDGGITFRDMDMRIPGSNPPYTMPIDNAVPTLSGAGFSPPNVLNFGGYAPGPGCSFGRIGSLRMIPSAIGTNASIDVWDLDFTGGNTIVFAAFMNGSEVARSTAFIPGGFSPVHNHMTVQARQFDELRLMGEGPNDQGVFFAVIDNVAVMNSGGGDCYANCDGSTVEPILNVNDFVCFQTKFAAGDSYANCDGSTVPPILNVNDFVCFMTKYAAGCS